MKFKISLLIMCMIICLFAISSVCASDVNETTITSEDSAQIPNEITLDEPEDINIDKSVANDDKFSSSADNDRLRAPQIHTVNNSNVDEIFSGENGTLSDNINAGDTLDINGTIDKNRYLVINKPVNIISSERNAVINLHTVIGDTVNNIPKFSFVINEGASGSNISNLFINNTQTWIYNVDGLYLENITINVRSAYNLGGDDKGHTAIRYCNHVTLNNCSIFTENTNAKCLVIYVTSNLTLINSKIEGQGNIGSIITLDCPNEIYDAPYEDYPAVSTNNSIKNCIIKTGDPNAFPIEINNADNITIDGIKVYASKNIKTGKFATVINSNFYNASGIELDEYSIAYNNTVDGSGSNIQGETNVYNNTFKDVKISGNGIFTKNIVTGKLTISKSANPYNNTLNSIYLQSGSKYSNITNNNLSGTITVDDVNVTIKFNEIRTENDYTIIVRDKGAVVTNNVLWAKTKFGDNAVSRYQDTTVVADNKPYTSFKLLQFLINKATCNITLGQDFYYNDEIDDDMTGITINKDITLIGNGYTIDGKEKARIFQIRDNANVVIENLVFINGKAQSEEYKQNNHDIGGAVIVREFSNLTIINCTFTNNHAEQNGWGGAIFITGNSTLNIITCNFTDSYAQDAGNVLYALDGNYVSILDSNINGINIGDIDINDIGDDIYNDKGEMGLLAPIKIFTTHNLIANISDYDEGKETTITIKEPSHFNGSASLTVNNQTISNIQFNDSIGTVKLNLTPEKAYTATIRSDNAEYDRNIGLNLALLYAPATATSNEFMVRKMVDVIIYAPNIVYGEHQTIKATIDGTGNVTIKLNNEIIKESLNITDNKIEYQIEELLTPGDYTVEVTYHGNNHTASSSGIARFTVNKIGTQITGNSITATYNINKELVITLKDNNGKPISDFKLSVNLNGAKTFTTDKNGQIRLSTSGLAPNTYTAKISFAGNANYKESSANVKVAVKKATPKMTAKAKTFKRSLKTKKYTITLKNNLNKAMKNTKVTLNIKGKTYKATTNSKGQATFKITKLNKKGSFKATVKFAGNKYYNSVAKNIKIKIK